MCEPEYMQTLLADPDIDTVIDAAKVVLRDAKYDGIKKIHPRFRQFFIDELAEPGVDPHYAEALFEIAKQCIDIEVEVEVAFGGTYNGR